MINPTTQRARILRQTANGPEQALWVMLKASQLAGYKCTRQYPIGPYFADFACRKPFLLVELDGGQHVESSYDKGRDQYLLDEGYSILRLPSASVLTARDAVCETILAALHGSLEDKVTVSDLSFTRSRVLPRRYRRHHPWIPPKKELG